MKTWYRALLPDGGIWCETSDPEECVRMSKGMDVRFMRFPIMCTEGPWQEWKPDAPR